MTVVKILEPLDLILLLLLHFSRPAKIKQRIQRPLDPFLLGYTYIWLIWIILAPILITSLQVEVSSKLLLQEYLIVRALHFTIFLPQLFRPKFHLLESFESSHLWPNSLLGLTKTHHKIKTHLLRLSPNQYFLNMSIFPNLSFLLKTSNFILHIVNL